MKRILMTCGETSGEERAAGFVREIKAIDPFCRISALGGETLERAGAEIEYNIKDFAFMGFSEIAAGIPKVLALENDLRKRMKRGEFDLFIPVDYPGMNLRLAACARKHAVPVLYFISPQVWAWGKWRIRKIKRNVDLMAVILPFEEKIYRDAGIPVFFAGHPMLEEIDEPDIPKHLPEGGRFTVLIFPGSRRQEVKNLLPPILSAAVIIKDRYPRCRFKIGLAPLIDESSIDIPGPLEGSIEAIRNGVAELSGADLVLAASGTVTLQAALSGTPAVVVYRTSSFTYRLGRMLVKIPWIAMPNVLAGKRLLPELIQNEVTPRKIADEAFSLVEDPARYGEISKELLAIRSGLSRPGGLAELARRAIEMSG